MNKMIKDIVKRLEPSATLQINEESKRLEIQGKKIYKFGFGQSPFPVPEIVRNELKNNAHQSKYLSMQGLIELREAIAAYLNKKRKKKFRANDIIIGPGTKELMFLLQILFEGDILLPIPSWVSYAPQAILGRNKVHWIETTSSNNWFPTAQQIEDIVQLNKNKNYLLFLNSPNNPSGTICKNLSDLANVAKKYNLLILSDEIYSELSFSDEYDSISNYNLEGTIISSGLSKWCGAGGWRLGFFAIPDSLNNIKNSLTKLASESFSSVSSPIQYAAISAFTKDHSNYIERTTKILKEVGMYVYENLKSNKILINKPEGGFYLMPEFINNKFRTSSEMCKNIINETGVALLPGSVFGFSENKMLIRLSFTDFDGEKLLNNTSGCKEINQDILSKFAPNILEGVSKLKYWSKNI
jgi:aspartate aminotransferase